MLVEPAACSDGTEFLGHLVVINGGTQSLSNGPGETRKRGDGPVLVWALHDGMRTRTGPLLPGLSIQTRPLTVCSGVRNPKSPSRLHGSPGQGHRTSQHYKRGGWQGGELRCPPWVGPEPPNSSCTDFSLLSHHIANKELMDLNRQVDYESEQMRRHDAHCLTACT